MMPDLEFIIACGEIRELRKQLHEKDAELARLRDQQKIISEAHERFGHFAQNNDETDNEGTPLKCLCALATMVKKAHEAGKDGAK